MTTSFAPLTDRATSRAGRTGVPLRVAVVGCGAISRGYHLPVLAGHDGVQVVALVDRDVKRAGELARDYQVPLVLDDAVRLQPGQVDAAIVATPPAHHAPCCIDLARRGIHVLVEKPMAIHAEDARAMTAAAREGGVILTAGYFRRLFPAVGLLRSAIDAGALGRVVGFDAEEGDEYTWGLATLSNLSKHQGGGGVLIDIGSHVLDLLLYLFPGRFEVLSYQENSLGGIETDCLLRLRLSGPAGEVDGRVELSRTRRLRSTLRVRFERGTLELRTGERYKLNLLPEGVVLTDPDCGEARPFQVQAAWADEPETIGYEAYRAEIDDWLQAIRGERPARLDAESAVRTVELIEQCYRQAERLPEPWVWGGLLQGAEKVPTEPKSSGRRVLITGAGGFIGCRLAEVLHLAERWQVRALVHRPSGASRLARLPVEMVQGDLKSPQDMARAVAGCDAVVHCAVGTAYGQRREIFAVTVDGTRKLLQAARQAGVKRFVHLSSIAVHGLEVEGIMDEQTPVRPTPGDDYSESKAAAEAAVLAEGKAGLPVVVLRPGNVYGPFSKTFSVRPIQYLVRGKLVLVGSAETASNTVYVDNLIHAIVRGLEAPAEQVGGQVFTISDGDEMSWGEFYGYFAEQLGATLRTGPAEPAGRAPAGGGVLGWVGSWWRGAKAIMTSPELRGLGKRILNTPPYGTVPRWLLERSSWLDRRVRALVGSEAALVYRRPAAGPEDVMRMRPRGGVVRVDRARKVLGYAPPVTREQALKLTLGWIREARLG